MSSAPRAITSFGLGYMRPFPGTWGSLPPCAVGIAFLLLNCGPQSNPIVWYAVMAAFLIFFSGACVLQGDWAEARFGKKDPSQAVADETAGQALTYLCVPASAFTNNIKGCGVVLAGFILFRLWDILKPWPISRIQKVPGGWGILLDDLLAGIGAGVMLVIGIWLVR